MMVIKYMSNHRGRSMEKKPYVVNIQLVVIDSCTRGRN